MTFISPFAQQVRWFLASLLDSPSLQTSKLRAPVVSPARAFLPLSLFWELIGQRNRLEKTSNNSGEQMLMS